MTAGTLSADTFRPPLNRVRRRHRTGRRLVAGLGVLAALLAIGWGVVSYARWCGKGSHSVRLDGECIGLSDGSYTFGNADLADVGAKIKIENDRVAGADPNHVKIAVLSPMTATTTSPMTAGEVLHSVQGAYLAQVRANLAPPPGIGRIPQVQLILANEGSQETHWPTVVQDIKDELAGPHPIVGVVGLGVSLRETRDAALELSRHRVPMVGGALSGDGLDAASIPGLLNVSPGNRHYVSALAEYLGIHPELTTAMLIADAKDDLYTQTLAADFAERFDKLLLGPPKTFQGSLPGAPPPLFEYLVQDICVNRPQLVFFAGRSRDRDAFLRTLALRSCDTYRPIVLTGATGLSSSSLTPEARASGISMIYSTSDDTRQWSLPGSDRPAGFDAFAAEARTRFGGETLDDGYAVMFHDATLTMVEALRFALAPDRINRAQPQREQIGIQLNNLNGNRAVEGASGTLSFSAANGGRAGGKPVPVLRTLPDGSVRQVKLDGPVYRTPR